METTVILISRQRVVQSSNILLIKTRKPTESLVLIRLSRSQDWVVGILSPQSRPTTAINISSLNAFQSNFCCWFKNVDVQCTRLVGGTEIDI